MIKSLIIEMRERERIVAAGIHFCIVPGTNKESGMLEQNINQECQESGEKVRATQNGKTKR